MKKFLMFMMAAVLLLGATSCNSCKREKQTVGQTIVSDYDYMVSNYDSSFVWYESQIKLGGWIDEDNPPAIASVANVFQYFDGQPHVIIFTHYGDRCDTARHDDIWIEDCAMEPTDVKITYDEAYEWLQKANIMRPHSKNCILREPVGPYGCNPQYVFGNIHDCVFVDAVTGAVKSENPAFEPNK